MKPLIIACELLKYEVEQAKEKVSCDWPLVYIDGGLHLRPELLKKEIQKQLNMIGQETDTVILAMALCGNALDGLTAPVRTVVPKMDDCLTIFLHTDNEQHLNLKVPGNMYTTKGWLTVKNFIKEEYDRTKEKYGEIKTRKIIDAIYDGYTHLTLIDNGTYDIDEVRKLAEEAAAIINCSLKVEKGSNLILEKLFSGKWDKQFLVFGTGEIITMNSFF